MPFCNVSASQNGDEVTGNNSNNNDDSNKGIEIFYRTYGRGPIKVLMIIGFAATHSSWAPQIRALAGTLTPNDEKSTAGDRSSDDVDCESSGIEVCVFDNRGMGLSSVPTKRAAYTTTIMAEDAIALMDHLGWDKAHVFGHSMGGMIACKLAAMVPDRVLSLALLNVTGGGKECIPKINVQTLSVAIRFLMAKTPQKRAAVDLDTHYSQEYLEERVGEKTRRAILHQEYIEGISATGMQSSYGFEGHVNACWRHKITSAEFEAIHDAGFLVSVIHGRHDIIAQLCHARKFAEKLYPSARMIELHGGHLVSHERTKEVNASLQELIEASTKKITPCDWTNLPMGKPGCMSTCITWRWSKRKTEGAISLSFKDNCIAQIHDVVMCSFGLLSFTFQEMIKSIKSLRHLKRKFFFWS